MIQRTPYELWVEADGNVARYHELMREHGHFVGPIPCATCGMVFRHRHDADGRVVRTDVFGHDQRQQCSTCGETTSDYRVTVDDRVECRPCEETA
jgi:hypothetical protein